MQSFSRGWSFLKQAWEMAFKDKDLLKPSIYALVVGIDRFCDRHHSYWHRVFYFWR